VQAEGDEEFEAGAQILNTLQQEEDPQESETSVALTEETSADEEETMMGMTKTQTKCCLFHSWAFCLWFS
jgi:hypothetical protein